MTEEQLNRILDDQLTRFYKLIDGRLGEVRDELKGDIAAVRENVDRLHGALDTLSGRVQDVVTDNAARDAQLDRHDQAIAQLVDHMRPPGLR